MSVKVQAANSDLSELLSLVEAGRDMTIMRGEVAVATLRSAKTGRQRELGFVDYSVPDSFFEELPEEELRLWE